MTRRQRCWQLSSDAISTWRLCGWCCACGTTRRRCCNEREVLRALQGAYYVAGINKDVERAERQRLGGVSVETLSPQELLTRYFEVKGVPAERAETLLHYADEIMAGE